MARDNTVKYHWRVLQLLPGAERPSYAGLRVDVLQRADGELMIRYQGEAVDYQEGPLPSSALWGADSACSTDPEPQGGADGVVNSHLNEAQRERLSILESAAQEEAERRAGRTKPVPHQLRRTPTETQQAHWEAIQQAREQGFSLGPSPGTWGWLKIQRRNTQLQRARPPRNSAPRSEPRRRPRPDHQPPPTKPGDLFAFHLRDCLRSISEN